MGLLYIVPTKYSKTVHGKIAWRVADTQKLADVDESLSAEEGIVGSIWGERCSEFAYREGQKGEEPRSSEMLMLCIWESHRAAVRSGARHTARGPVEVNLKSLGRVGSLLWRTLSARLRYLDFSPIALRRHGRLLSVCVLGSGAGSMPNIILGDDSRCIFRSMGRGSGKDWRQRENFKVRKHVSLRLNQTSTTNSFPLFP